MTATVWTSEDCDRCKEVKDRLKADGYEIEERNARDLINGTNRDVDAMAQLASQNMQLPLIMIEGEYVTIEDVLKEDTK
jgi:glutaredoxin